MQKLIGQKLEYAINFLKNKGIDYQIIDNNFSVEGDTRLVVSIKQENNVVQIITGSFVFDVMASKTTNYKK